jgi:hypothetical protein
LACSKLEVPALSPTIYPPPHPLMQAVKSSKARKNVAHRLQELTVDEGRGEWQSASISPSCNDHY